AGSIGDVGDVLAVRRPLGIAFVDAAGGGEIACLSLLGGHSEQVAAGTEEGALAGVGNLIAADHLADILELWPAGQLLLEDADRHLGVLLAEQIEAVDVAGVLEHDCLVAERGILDVPIGEMSKLSRLLGAKIVAVEIESLMLVAVGEEIDLRSGPHRKS